MRHIEQCDIPFEGSERKGVKMRKPGEKYTFHNGGRAISVAEIYTLIEVHSKGTPKKCIFTNPPLVEVAGYLFLNASYMRKLRTDYATDNGGRGIRGGGMKTSPVRGIWELHHVTKLEAVKNKEN